MYPQFPDETIKLKVFCELINIIDQCFKAKNEFIYTINSLI